MKISFFGALVILCLICGCNNNDNPQPTNSNNNIDASLIINNWQVTELYKNGSSVSIAAINRYDFSQNNAVVFENITTNPNDTSTENGTWAFNNQNDSLMVVFPSGRTDAYKITQLSNSKMTWETSEIENNATINAKIVLTSY